MQFQLKIDTGNAAFDGEYRDHELARILRRLADTIENRGADEPIALSDVNGNRVGAAELQEEQREIGLTDGQRITLHSALSVYEPSHIAHEGCEAERDELLAILFEIRGADSVALLVEG